MPTLSSAFSQPTRFSGVSTLRSRLLLAALAALIAWGALSRPSAVQIAAAARVVSVADSDATLYRAIASRVAAGEGYYTAATAEQRARDYPLRPFVAVRLPTLAVIETGLGDVGLRVLIFALSGVAWFAFRRRCERSLPSDRLVPVASVLAATGLVPMLNESVTLCHDAWAGGLILLSLSLRSSQRFAAAVLVGFAAVAVRELALPYLCVMAIAAASEGGRRETAAWGLGIVAAAMMIAAHAWAVSLHVTALDPVSPGWAQAGGWSSVLEMARSYMLPSMLVPGLAPVIVPLCLLGWAAWPGSLGLRGALTTGGYVGGFMLIGRPDNAYWWLLVGPMIVPGLAFAPGALRDLFRAARVVRRYSQPA